MAGSAKDATSTDKDDDLGLFGASSVMCELRSQIRRVANSNAPVLILGETGTGKELVARAVHTLSKRANGPLICVNCGALNEELLESELFGHEQGAFTSAAAKRKGKFEAASSGTLFLDELNSTKPNFQVKLLRVLQDKAVTPVGSNESVAVDVRIIAASNQDLNKEVEVGRFRQDLLYRLMVLPLRAPALRARDSDVILLAEHFMRRFCDEDGKQFQGLSAIAQLALKRHRWPGNVRELENVIHRAVVMAERNGPDQPLEVSLELDDFAPAASDAQVTIADFVFDDLLDNRIPLDGLRQGSTRIGGVAEAVLHDILAGLNRFLASAAGQDLLARNNNVGMILQKMGLSVRRPGNESLFAAQLRDGIVEIYERHVTA